MHQQQLITDLKVPTVARIALLSSTATSVSKLFAAILFLLSQFQILIILLKPVLLSYQQDNITLPWVYENICEAINIENHVKFNESSSTTLMIFEIILVYGILYALLIGYIVAALSMKISVSNVLQRLWNIMSLVHPYIVFYPIHTICVKVFYGLTESDQLILGGQPQSSIAFRVLALVIGLANFVWSLLVLTLFETNIKTKNALAPKTTLITLLDLCFKVVMPILWTSIEQTESLDITLMVLGLIYCLLKTMLFFRYLPYYKLYFLKLASLSQSIITSFAISTLISKIISHQRSYSEYSLLLFIWILFIIFLVRLYHNNLHSHFKRILVHPTKLTNPYHIVHYMEIFKTYSAYTSSGLAAEKGSEKYLYYAATVKQSSMADTVCSDFNQAWSAKTQAEINHHFYNFYLELLNKSIQKNPKMKLLKVTLARFYAKKEELCVVADNALDEGLRRWYSYKNSFYLTKLTIANSLKNRRQKQLEPTEGKTRGHLDVQNFIQLSTEFRIIKKEIIEQLKIQGQFWKDFESSKPDFLDLVRNAKKIHSKSRVINRAMVQYKEGARINFVESLLVCGLYYYFVQNDTAKGQKVIRDYFNIKSRRGHLENEESDNNDDLTTKSFYFVISASSRRLGIITDCSGKAKKILGISKELFIGKPFTSLMPSSYAKVYESVLNTSYYGVKSDVLDKPREVAIFSKNGYLLPMKMQISLSYLPGYGLCFYALLKPTQDHKRLALVSTSGRILSISKEFGEDMGIIQGDEKAQWDIHELCPDIGKIMREFERAPKKSFFDFKTKNIVNGNGSTSSPRRLLSMSTNLKDLDTETRNDKDTEMLEVQKNSTSVKGVNLTFYPQVKRKGYEKRVLSKQLTREGVIYRVDLRELMTEGGQVFELKLEKADDGSPRRGFTSRNFTTRLTLKAHKQENEQTLTSLESPKLEPSNLLSPTIQPLTSPAVTSNRGLLINTLQTNEDANFEKGDSPSHGLIKNRRTELEMTTTNNMETHHEFDKFELPPARITENLMSQIHFAKGDSQIDEEEDEDADEKGLSEILQSDSAENKFNGSPLHRQAIQQDRFEANLIKANFRAASSSQATPLTRENNTAVRAYKLIRKIISSKKHSLSTIYYNLSFIVAMVILLSFLIWLNFHTSTTSTTVGSLGSVIHNAYFRNFWTKVANQDTLLVLVFGDPSAVAAGTTSFNGMIKANQDLEVSVGGLDQDFQDMFYQRNVRIHELDENNEQQLISIDDSFQATKKIFNKGLNSVLNRVELAPAEIVSDQRTRFVLDNSSNDLLIVSENLLEILKNNLFDTLLSSKNSIVAYLAITMSVLGVFIMISLRYVIGLNTESSNCMNILFTLHRQQISNTELCLNTFKELLELDSEEVEFLGILDISKSYSVQNDTRNQHTSSYGNAKNNRKEAVRTISMKKAFTRNYFIFASLFVCLGLMVAFMLIYHSQALDKLAVMEKQQMNSNAALDYLNTIALISIGMMQILLENSNTTIRNKEILPTFIEAIQPIKQVTHLQDSLKNEKGEFSPGQEEILFNFNCSEATSEYYSWGPEVMVPECETLSDGLNSVGLVTILGKLDVYVGLWIEKYKGLSKDPDTLYQNFMDDYVTFGNIATMTDISIIILGHSYMASTADFTDSVKQTENERILLTWVAIIVALLLGALTYIFVVRRLSDTEFEKMDLLALVPNKLIFENFMLKRYILKISRGDAKEAEKLLSMK